jgi:pilus assembly protein CpaC
MIQKGTSNMAKRTLIRTASTAALIAAAGAALVSLADAADRRVAPRAPIDAQIPVENGVPVIQVVGSDQSSRFVPLGIGKSVVIDLPRDIKDVLVADPTIANAVVRSARRAYLIGVKVGQTNMFFFDAEGRQIAGFDIAVKRDLGGLQAILKQALPGEDIRVEAVGDGIMLTGSVATPAQAQQAYDLANRIAASGGAGGFSFGGGGDAKVINNIIVRGRDQVMIKVTVAEVQRDVIKQLGVDLSGSFSTGTAVVNFNQTNPFSAFGQSLSGSSVAASIRNVTATLKAMERAGVVRTLAEPNVTVVSGETGLFVAGGEFPIPAGLSCDTTRSPPLCQQQIDFKKFGVSLSFTPVVLGEGRISLKVGTEVSDLSSENAITITPAQGQNLTIPSIRARRAETVVEIPSGGSLAMAGMIQEQTKQQINGFPGLQQLPILGALFKSRDYINKQTELMILATPYVVRAVAQKDLSRPDDGFADAPDSSTVLLSRLNKIYGIPDKVEPKQVWRGNVGFIID